jgi:hypothetical protein
MNSKITGHFNQQVLSPGIFNSNDRRKNYPLTRYQLSITSLFSGFYFVPDGDGPYIIFLV